MVKTMSKHIDLHALAADHISVFHGTYSRENRDLEIKIRNRALALYFKARIVAWCENSDVEYTEEDDAMEAHKWREGIYKAFLRSPYPSYESELSTVIAYLGTRPATATVG